MIISSAELVTTSVDVNKCPKPSLPEYAFIGRSNVGKSSLINMLTGRKGLARVSENPGKTRVINHFLINDSWYLVDLPGYGYAKVSKQDRLKWENFISEYIIKRENLLGLFVLIDSRIPPQQIDLEFMEWLGENNIPFVMVFTKTDKVKKMQLSKNIASYQRKLLERWETLPNGFYSSSAKNLGREEILSFIHETNQSFVRG